MNPTPEQLADPDWWNEWRPSDSKFFCTTLRDFVPVSDACSQCIERPNEHRRRDLSRVLNPQNLSDYHHSIEIDIPPFSVCNQHGTQDWEPPVGVECQIFLKINDAPVCKNAIITYQGDGIFCYRNTVNGFEYAANNHYHRFSPVKSERDKTIEKAWEIFKPHADSVTTVMEGLNKLHDDGMLVDPERKPMSYQEAYAILSRDFDLDHGHRAAILDSLGYKE